MWWADSKHSNNGPHSGHFSLVFPLLLAVMERRVNGTQSETKLTSESYYQTTLCSVFSRAITAENETKLNSEEQNILGSSS